MFALTHLPAEQRETIVLKIWNDLTFEQIGELLGISPNTAAGRYRYGLHKLRKHLAQLNYERNGSFGDALEILEPASPFPGA
jgi:RNA polymerase sigma-70 factor (ECF subfamily)